MSVIILFAGSAYFIAAWCSKTVVVKKKAFASGAEKSIGYVYDKAFEKKHALLTSLVTIILMAVFMTGALYVVYFFQKIVSAASVIFAGISLVLTYRLLRFLVMKMRLPEWCKTTLCGLIGLIVTALWIICPGILTYAFAGWVTTVVILVEFRNTSVKSIIIIYCALALYDAVAVFGTGMMEKFAGTAENYPSLLKIPASYADFKSQPSINKSSDKANYCIIGLGDIVAPGLLIVVAIHEGRKHKMRYLATGSAIGWIGGLLVALTVVNFFPKTDQPATIYLLPMTALGFMVTAMIQGRLKSILASP